MNLVSISQAQGRVPVTVFHLQERITLGNFSELENLARQAVDNGTRDLVLDLSQAVSLTSIGIRAIVIIHKLLSTDGGRHLRVVGSHPHIREVLDVSGVTQYIEVYDTLEQAVAAF